MRANRCFGLKKCESNGKEGVCLLFLFGIIKSSVFVKRWGKKRIDETEKERYTKCNLIGKFWRQSQVVRQRSATPLSPVRIRVAPFEERRKRSFFVQLKSGIKEKTPS